MSIPIYGQQLLLGFEDWEKVDDHIENPVGWEVNNYSPGLDSLFNRFFKDSIHVVEGNYAMRAEKDSMINNAFFDCESRADQYLMLDSLLTDGMSVYFHIKTQSLTEWPESFVDVTIGFSKDNEYQGRVEWFNYEEIEEFEEIELPIEFVGADAISISISLASQNGGLDECSVNSIGWIDNFRIAESSTVFVHPIEIEDVVISPNPTDGVISLSTSEFHGSNYQVLDVMGRSLQEGIVNNNQIMLEYDGINIIVIDRGDGSLLRLKCIKRN